MPTVPVLPGRQVAPRAIPNVRADSGASPLAFGADLARAGQTVASVFAGIAQEEREKADRAALLEAESRLKETENTLLMDPESGAYAQQGKNAFDLPNRVMPAFQAAADEIERGLGSDRQKLAFRELRRQRAGLVERDLNRHELGERERYYDQVEDAAIAQSIESAASYSADPERIMREIVTQRDVIADKAHRKGWAPEVTEQAMRAAESGTHEAVVGALISRGDFNAASRYLAEASPRMKDTTVETLQRRLLIEEDRELARAERQRRLDEDAASKEGDRLFSSGRLNSAWIEANRDRLSAEDYRYFYRQLRGGDDAESPRDVMLYAGLRERSGRGEDVRAEARTALQQGRIRSSDYDRILGEVEQQRPGWYKRGTDFITTSAAVSDLNPDPAAAQRKAQMLDDWNVWAEENPGATDAQAREAYRRIVSEYAIVNLENITLMKRAPRFLVGSRMAPDFPATMQATAQAYERGEISKDELNQQALLIKEWEDAWRRTQTQ